MQITDKNIDGTTDTNVDESFTQLDVAKYRAHSNRTHKIVKVKIAEIIGSERKRTFSETKVIELENSIRISALSQPIVLTSDLQLVAGAHRLEACRRIGMREIAATLIPGGEFEKELAEIEENLTRHELTALERCFQLKRRKELYEVVNPQSSKGKYDRQRRPKLANKATDAANNNPTAIIQTDDGISDSAVAYSPASFAELTAKEARVTARTIQREIFTAANLDPETVALLRDNAIVNRSNQLHQLAQLPANQQKEVALKMTVGNVPFVQALRQMVGATETPESLTSETAALVGLDAPTTSDNSTTSRLPATPTSPDGNHKFKRLFDLLKELFEFQANANATDLGYVMEWKKKHVFDYPVAAPLARYLDRFALFTMKSFSDELGYGSGADWKEGDAGGDSHWQPDDTDFATGFAEEDDCYFDELDADFDLSEPVDDSISEDEQLRSPEQTIDNHDAGERGHGSEFPLFGCDVSEGEI